MIAHGFQVETLNPSFLCVFWSSKSYWRLERIIQCLGNLNMGWKWIGNLKSSMDILNHVFKVYKLYSCISYELNNISFIKFDMVVLRRFKSGSKYSGSTKGVT